MKQVEKPVPGEYGDFYAGYVDLVPDVNLLQFLRDQKHAYRKLISSIPEERRLESYAPGKWNIAQVCNHINDSERIFCYRALALSRGEQNAIPGYDHIAYVEDVDVANRTLHDLLDEFFTIRDATLSFLEGLPDRYAGRSGIVNEANMSVRALAYIMAGHVSHHIKILSERYVPITEA